MSGTNPVQKALAVFDNSPTKLAVAIGNKVLRQHVEHWLKSGRVPSEHCPRFSEVTGIALWEIRPDDWHRTWPMLIGTKDAPAVPADADKASA